MEQITIDIINILHETGNLKLKSFYKSFRNLTTNWLNNYDIKGYCRYSNNKTGKLCLTKSSYNYCKRHSKYMLNNELSLYFNLCNNLFIEKIDEKVEEMNTGDYLPKEPVINNKDIKPSCPTFDEIYPPKKPDECGNSIKNIIKNKGTYNINLDENKIKSISESIEKIGVKSITYYKQNVDFTKRELEVFSINNVITARNNKLLEIKDIKDNNGIILPIVNDLLLNSDNNIITNIEDYKNKLENIDYSSYDYKGIHIRRLCRSTIELQFKLLLSKNSNTNIDGKLLKFINKIVKRIPK